MLGRLLLVAGLLASSAVARGEEVIVWRHDLGAHHLLYVASGERQTYPGWSCIQGTGHFFLLDAADSLVSDTEAIEQRAESAIEVKDVDFALDARQISVEDLDGGCKENAGAEVLVELRGPSDDPELLILGFDPEGTFRKLVDIEGQYLGSTVVSEDRLQIRMRVREDLAGTMYHEQSYLMDTVTRQTYKVAHVFVKRSHFFLGYDMSDWPMSCLKPVAVYFDPVSAVRREPMALVGRLGAGWGVSISEFYRAEGNGAAYVACDSLSGWMNQDDVNWEHFMLPAAD